MPPPIGAFRALVTGASSGIGEAYARKLAAGGVDVVLVARRRDRLEQLAHELRDRHGVAVEVLAADLVDPVDLDRVATRVAAAEEPIDMVVNNAGFGTSGPLAGLDPAVEQAMIALNAGALVRLTQAALPGMLERGQGTIVNVASIAGLTPLPGNATYAGTKALVLAFSEAVAEEVRGQGVRVQALCPGLTRSEFQETAGFDARRLPGWVWQSSDEVVDVSLRALGGRRVRVVPGLVNRVAAIAAAFVPVAVRRRVAGLLGR